MATRNFKKILLVSLLGILGLTACDDDIASYPKDGAILPPSQEQTIYNNELSSIYESIRDGSLASDVLDKLLYEYANTIFGRYSSKAPSYSTNDKEDDKFLSVIANGTDAEKEAFVLSHKAYWPNGEIPGSPSAEEKKTAIARLEAIYQSVEDRIAEALASKIANGAYSEHSIFSEEKFLASLYFDGKKVADYRTAPCYEGIISPEIENKDIFTAGILHKANYYEGENTYALDENIESIYRELLIEQYITDESYSTLGRSYARKVNVLSLKVDDSNKGDVPALVNHLVKEVIAGKGVDKLVVD